MLKATETGFNILSKKGDKLSGYHVLYHKGEFRVHDIKGRYFGSFPTRLQAMRRSKMLAYKRLTQIDAFIESQAAHNKDKASDRLYVTEDNPRGLPPSYSAISCSHYFGSRPFSFTEGMEVKDYNIFLDSLDVRLESSLERLNRMRLQVTSPSKYHRAIDSTVAMTEKSN